jgi:hypothetical protein
MLIIQVFLLARQEFERLQAGRPVKVVGELLALEGGSIRAFSI